MQNLVSTTCPSHSPDLGQKPNGGISDFQISGQCLINENRHNSRASYDIDMEPAIIFIIFRDFLMFYQIFFSPQMKRCTIITYKLGIYEFPHELLNELRLTILGNQERFAKSQNFIELYPSAEPSCQNENFVNISKKFLKNKN